MRAARARRRPRRRSATSCRQGSGASTVLSAIPATEGNNAFTNAQIAESRDYVNGLAQETQRVVSHAMVLPNYNHEQQLEGMATIVNAAAPVGAWKCYTPWGSFSPGQQPSFSPA